jgi:hypothetical protein
MPALEAAGRELPLYALLRRAADPNLDEKYRHQINVHLLPYLHARPRSDLTAKPVHMMSDEELIAVRDAEADQQRQLAKGGG